MSEQIIHEPAQDVIVHIETARPKFAHLFKLACAAVEDGYAVEASIKPLKNTRSLQANAAMWASLGDIANQVVWHGEKLTDENWKDVLSSSLKRQKAVAGIDGGFVVLGARTSRMSIKEMSAMIELCHAFGAQHGVKFTAPKWME